MKRAACLLAFERPHYLRKTVESLENLIDKEQYDWYLFQDGAVNKFSDKRVAKDRDVKIANNILEKAELPNKTVIQNEYNLSIPLQYRQMFDLFDEGYDVVHGFEDDLVVSKYSLLLKSRILEQYPDSIPTVYTNRSVSDIDNIKEKLDILVKNHHRSSYHSFAIKKEQFKSIEDRYADYINMVGNIDYAMRNHDKIKEEFDVPRSSNDNVMQHLFIRNGYYRLMPYISRGLYIGIEGQHSSADSYLNNFEGNLGKLEYESDADRHSFEVIEE